uniref:Uncharacterized protein n=1 Tax=Picea glauca TaxID=3330 RepID=A0A101M1Q3_PICGL|nr:hypothetical protein ABT39_MTgene3824 [Picea glauca]
MMMRIKLSQLMREKGKERETLVGNIQNQSQLQPGSRRRERIDQRSSVLHVIHLDIMPLNVLKGRERVSSMHLPLMLMMRMSICIKGRRPKKMSMIPKKNTFSFQLSQGLSPPIVILG